MKILYITNGINGPGGLERVLSIKASYLAEYYKYEVFILSLNGNGNNPFYTFSDKIKFLNIVVSGNPLKYIFNYIKGVRRTVEYIKPDIVLVCDDGLKGFFIPKILKEKIPIIYERHASISLNAKNSIKGKLIILLMKSQVKNFSKFVVLTKSNIKEWKGNNIIAIPNPLSFNCQSDNPLDQKKVIAVGSHSYNKGFDLLLKSWKEINKNHPDWKLTIYGKSDTKKQFIKLARQLEIENTVFFYEPVLDIKQKYLESSIMVLPSRSEGFGMVLIEAMACGVPCVSFDCPSGPRDIISNNIDGFLVPAENIELMIDKILILIKDQQLRLNFGFKARENVKRFDIEVIMKQWDNLYKSLYIKV